MNGLSRPYWASDGETGTGLLSVAFNDECDVVVALAAYGDGDPATIELALTDTEGMASIAGVAIEYCLQFQWDLAPKFREIRAPISARAGLPAAEFSGVVPVQTLTAKAPLLRPLRSLPPHREW